MSGLKRQNGEEDKLASAISFTEWVNSVEFGKKVGGEAGKILWRLSAQKILLLKLAKKLVHFRGNMLWVAEGAATFGDANGAKPPGPSVHILE